MNFILNVSVFILLFASKSIAWNTSSITGYHFHTYFFQNNDETTREAIVFRKQIQQEISDGLLSGCRLNHVNYGPRGPHPIGSYETCCNKSSLSTATSWFMQNRSNLSILVHPLTRWEVIDHTDRAMFLGASFRLDLSVLSWDLGEPDKCLPIDDAMP